MTIVLLVYTTVWLLVVWLYYIYPSSTIQRVSLKSSDPGWSCMTLASGHFEGMYYSSAIITTDPITIAD